MSLRMVSFHADLEAPRCRTQYGVQGHIIVGCVYLISLEFFSSFEIVACMLHPDKTMYIADVLDASSQGHNKGSKVTCF